MRVCPCVRQTSPHIAASNNILQATVPNIATLTYDAPRSALADATLVQVIGLGAREPRLLASSLAPASPPLPSRRSTSYQPVPFPRTVPSYLYQRAPTITPTARVTHHPRHASLAPCPAVPPPRAPPRTRRPPAWCHMGPARALARARARAQPPTSTSTGRTKPPSSLTSSLLSRLSIR
jgi:hypothetical protein